MRVSPYFRIPFLTLTILPFAGSHASEDAEPSDPVTFSEHIAPIVYEKCARCHRPGEVAPFAFTDYASTKRRARTIRRVVNEKFMPPWHPEKGWGKFRGDLSLSEDQIELINRWVDTGASEGDPSKAPALPDYPEGWSIGEPDLIVEMEEPFEVYAEGRDIYRYFTLPLNLDEDKWVRVVEVRPSERPVVHHVLFFLDDQGKARELEEEDPVPGFRAGFPKSGSLGGWAVGGTPLALSEGYAMPLTKGSDLVIQTHFHPTGKVEREKTKVGIYFADRAPEKRLIEFQVPPAYGEKTGLSIAPGDASYEVRDHLVVPEDMDLITIWAHAHQVCRSFQVEATLPGGAKEKLFRIGQWQFDWQGQYAFEKPLRLPKGTRIDTWITWDNSAGNPDNPFSPPRRIFWGEQSTDEMGSVIFQCVAAEKADESALISGLREQKQESIRRFAESARVATRQRKVLALDEDGDDRVSLDEAPRQHHGAFRRLDRNRDGLVTMGEVEEFGAFLEEE